MARSDRFRSMDEVSAELARLDAVRDHHEARLERHWQALLDHDVRGRLMKDAAHDMVRSWKPTRVLNSIFGSGSVGSQGQSHRHWAEAAIILRHGRHNRSAEDPGRADGCKQAIQQGSRFVTQAMLVRKLSREKRGPESSPTPTSAVAQPVNRRLRILIFFVRARTDLRTEQAAGTHKAKSPYAMADKRRGVTLLRLVTNKPSELSADHHRLILWLQVQVPLF
jgi:hypothetical protein